MSKLARTPVDVKNIKVEKKDNFLHLSGMQGHAVFEIPTGVNLEITPEFIKINGEDSCICGTAKSNLKNLVSGLREKFKVILKLSGVGYRVNVEGKDIIFNVGYSHEVRMEVPANIHVNIPKSSSPILEISSTDKLLVTTFASRICRIKKYNPYKQYGILWEGKHYLKKQARAKR